MTRTTRTTIAAAFVVLAAALTACNNDKQPTAASPTTTAPAVANPSSAQSAAPDTPELAKQKAIDAYLGMHRAFLKAGEIADPAYPDLAKYTAGAALQRLTGSLKSMQQDGLRGRGDSVFYPEIASLSPPAAPTKAQIRDCMDTSKTEVYKANGDPYQDEPGGWRLVLADVELTSGEWKVTDFAIREVGSCKR